MNSRFNVLVGSLVTLGMAISVVAQSTPVYPSTLTLKTHYPRAAFGLSTAASGIGGFEFNSTGTTIYYNDMGTSVVKSATVVRDATGRISGFSNITTLGGFTASYWLDSGSAIAPNGTLFSGGYAPFEMIQDIPGSPLPKSYIIDLANYGISGSAGGIEWVSAPVFATPRLLVGDYTNGILYELPLNPVNADGTYTPSGNAIQLATGVQNGMCGFCMLPPLFSVGPFGLGGGMLNANYDTSKVIFHAFDTATGKPLTDAAGAVIAFDVITNLNRPMDVEFDPLTGDLFVSQFFSGPNDLSAMIHFTGTISPQDGMTVTIGHGCKMSNGARPIIVASGLDVTLPFSIQMQQGPITSPFCTLNVGLGYLGGIDLFGVGCRAFADPLLMVPTGPTDASGNSSKIVVQPVALAGLKGITLFFQYWAFSPGSNPLSLTVSDGVAVLAK